jgi:hypothetical protein
MSGVCGRRPVSTWISIITYMVVSAWISVTRITTKVPAPASAPCHADAGAVIRARPSLPYVIESCAGCRAFSRAGALGVVFGSLLGHPSQETARNCYHWQINNPLILFISV